MTTSRIGLLSLLLFTACAGGAARGTASRTDDGRPGGTGSEARTVEGRVELLDRANRLTLAGSEAAGHAFDRLTLDERTQVTVDGRQATLADVHPGDPVRASFAPEGDRLHVIRLQVETPRASDSP